MATAQQSAQEILSLFVIGGARPGRTFPVQVEGAPLTLAEFPGALQKQFLQAGYQISDLIAGLAYAVAQGWLSMGQFYPGAGDGTIGSQIYVLEQAGFAEAGGTAPTIAASGQQLINTAAALNDRPGAARFDASLLQASFVGAVGENTFAVEDVMPGYGYALAQGWVRPCGQKFFDPVFSLTAAGAAQAS
jgi:hypothetical protein